MNAERLRVRMQVASQKFALELTDALLEALGEEGLVEGEGARPKRLKRRPPTRPPPVLRATTDAEKQAAAASLAKAGFLPRTGT